MQQPMRSTGGSVFSRRSGSAARSMKLRERLRRSGAMASSRSALSRQDATSEDFLVVDVGTNKTPTVVEQLIARFEQHGLRRCLLSDSDVSEYTLIPGIDLANDFVALLPTQEGEHVPLQQQQPPAVRASPVASSHRSGSDEGHPGDGKREPYFYLCVPCEARLTNISHEPATQRMLEDMHFHFASAAHREAASWMADPDIDETLSPSSLIEDPRAYTRIYVNGVPMLLSRRPGGGDMFYPLPHETERVSLRRVVRRAPVAGRAAARRGGSLGEEEDARHPERGMLFPSPRYSSDANYWYRPLTSLYTQSKQVVSHVRRGLDGADSTRKGKAVRQRCAREAIRVHHIPMHAYRQGTLLEKDRVTVHPCLFALERRKLPKSAVKRHRWTAGGASVDIVEPIGRRCFYVQPAEPHVDGDSHPTGPDPDGSTWRDRCLVEANGVYRLVLESDLDRRERRAKLDATEHGDFDGASTTGSQPVLTRELLSQVASCMPFRQHHSVGTSMGSRGSPSSWGRLLPSVSGSEEMSEESSGSASS